MNALRVSMWAIAGAIAIQGTVDAHSGPVDMRGGHSYRGGVGYHLHSSAMLSNLRPGAYVVTNRTGYRNYGYGWTYGGSTSQVVYPRGSSLSTTEVSRIQRLEQQVRQLQKEKEDSVWKTRAADARKRLEAERLATRQRVQRERVAEKPTLVYPPKYICYFHSGRRKEVADYMDEGAIIVVLFTNGGTARYPKTLISRFTPIFPD